MFKLYGVPAAVKKIGINGSWAVCEYKDGKFWFVTSAKNQKMAAEFCVISPDYRAIELDDNVELV